MAKAAAHIKNKRHALVLKPLINNGQNKKKRLSPSATSEEIN